MNWKHQTLALCAFILGFLLLPHPGYPAGSRAQSVSVARVELFVTDWCPSCQYLEKELKAAGIAFERFNVEKDSAAQAEFLKLGGRGVPLTRVDGSQVFRGALVDEIKAAISAANRPASSIEQSI